MAREVVIENAIINSRGLGRRAFIEVADPCDVQNLGRAELRRLTQESRIIVGA